MGQQKSEQSLAGESVMTHPAPPESETPEMTLVEHLRDEAKVADNLSHWHTRDLLLRAATALSLAQTEIKGHMRVEDELRAEVANVTRLEFYWLEQAKLIGERYEQAEARCAAAYEAAAKIAEPKSGNPESAWEQGYWAAENSISKEIRALSQVPSVSDASALEKRPTPLANELAEAQARIAALEKALSRTLSWLSSYPGGGALSAYDEARAALKDRA